MTVLLRNKFSWLLCIFYVFFSVLQSKTQFHLDEDDTDFHFSAKVTGTTEEFLI